MRLGRGRWDWYDLIFVALAAAVVYPDSILDWVASRTGKVSSWWQLLALECLTIGLLVGSMVLLMPVYPRLQWWHPLMSIAVLGVFRFARWFILEIFGMND